METACSYAEQAGGQQLRLLTELSLRGEAGWRHFGGCRWGWSGAFSLFDRGGCVGWALFTVAIAALLLVAGLDDGAHPVVAFGVNLDSVDLALEAGEALAEFLDCKDELDHRAFGAPETLAGHGHGDAGRVRDEHHGGDAAGHLGEADFFGLVA